ncbi:MAG: aminodeoxychorismate/anthranilate synthase component II [Parvularcula sp.]|jgi:anthranilate synthase component 2|nr:aminodeoxychorismate/anthranilate synthase component II [Parvularcula sp.]
MLLIVDNYDSFTYNLVQALAPYGPVCKVVRNDALTASEAMALSPRAVILSPGPCDPDRAGICLDMVKAAADRRVPLFGVCLGHQSIAQAFGAKIVRAPRPVHGKVSTIRHEDDPVFEGLPGQFEATRYHSLIAAEDGFPASLEILARAEDDQTIMALKVRDLPIYGVQFHPESYASPAGVTILDNFLRLAGVSKARTAA